MDWKEFEVLVAAVYQAETEGAEVLWDAEIAGRQFDIAVRFKKGLHDYLTVVECKHNIRPVSVDKVDAFVTKSQSAKAHRAVMASMSGYQAGCATVARANDIILLTAEESYAEPPRPADATPIQALNVYTVTVAFENGEIFDLGDGSKLQYLMHKTSILQDGTKKTLSDIVSEWSAQNVIALDDENEVTIPLRPNSTFEGEYECAFRPTAVQFCAKLISAFGSAGPLLDHQLQQNLLQKWTLRDIEGSVVSEQFFADLALGAWNTVEPGKFYRQPAFNNFYYCQSIEDDIITWVLVESFQHGQLVQAVYTQKTQYQNQYVLVKGAEKIAELKVRLAKLKH